MNIEDPFETFYDVAHVLKAGSNQRLRKEFVLAYSKIVKACLGETKMDGAQLINYICEPIAKE